MVSLKRSWHSKTIIYFAHCVNAGIWWIGFHSFVRRKSSTTMNEWMNDWSSDSLLNYKVRKTTAVTAHTFTSLTGAKCIRAQLLSLSLTVDLLTKETAKTWKWFRFCVWEHVVCNLFLTSNHPHINFLFYVCYNLQNIFSNCLHHTLFITATTQDIIDIDTLAAAVRLAAQWSKLGGGPN